MSLRRASSSAGWALQRFSASSHRRPSRRYLFTSASSLTIWYRLCSAIVLTRASLPILRSPSKVRPLHAGQSQSRDCMSESLNVPSMNIILSSRANLAYPAESKRSHPISVAKARIIGCPAPNRCTGRPWLIPLFEDMTTSTSSE